MTALDFALVVLWRAVNALLTATIVIPLFVLLAIAGWPIYERASVGLSVCVFPCAVAALRRVRKAATK